eukprot:16169147-Heterocapsa_arctica.AAC.1
MAKFLRSPISAPILRWMGPDPTATIYPARTRVPGAGLRLCTHSRLPACFRALGHVALAL